MADHAKVTFTQSTLAPTRKVAASGVAILGMVILVGAGTALTPDLFDFAGRWSVVIYGGLIAGVGWLTAYLTKSGVNFGDNHGDGK